MSTLARRGGPPRYTLEIGGHDGGQSKPKPHLEKRCQNDFSQVDFSPATSEPNVYRTHKIESTRDVLSRFQSSDFGAQTDIVHTEYWYTFIWYGLVYAWYTECTESWNMEYRTWYIPLSTE